MEIFLAALLLISLSVNYIVLIRRIKYKEPLVPIPSFLLNRFSRLDKRFVDMSVAIRNTLSSHSETLNAQAIHSQQASENVSKKYEEILEAFSSLQQGLNSKDKEIERLKKGYDHQLIKSYVKKLIRLTDMADSFEQDTSISEETKREVAFVLAAVGDLIEDLGVERYSIDSGVSTKSDVFGLPPANEWQKVPVNGGDAEPAFTVKQTIKSGFYINSEVKEILRFAKIEVYVEGESDG